MFAKDPQKQKGKEQARRDKERAKEETRRQQQNEAAWRAFWNSPQGRARAARDAGEKFFQISLDISQTERTVTSVLSGSPETKTRAAGGQLHVLEAIESEGWKLEHVGYVFQETGSVSRDKFLSSGQTEQVTGRVVGIYLFRAITDASRSKELTPDETSSVR